MTKDVTYLTIDQLEEKLRQNDTPDFDREFKRDAEDNVTNTIDNCSLTISEALFQGIFYFVNPPFHGDWHAWIYWYGQDEDGEPEEEHPVRFEDAVRWVLYLQRNFPTMRKLTVRKMLRALLEYQEAFNDELLDNSDIAREEGRLH